MKLKYYLRGMGVGIILTAIIMGIALRGRKEQLSDAEIMARARELGMIDATVLSDYAAQDGFGDALGGLGENGNGADGSAGESVRSVTQSSLDAGDKRVVFEPIDPMQKSDATIGKGNDTTGGPGGAVATDAATAKSADGTGMTSTSSVSTGNSSAAVQTTADSRTGGSSALSTAAVSAGTANSAGNASTGRSATSGDSTTGRTVAMADAGASNAANASTMASTEKATAASSSAATTGKTETAVASASTASTEPVVTAAATGASTASTGTTNAATAASTATAASAASTAAEAPVEEPVQTVVNGHSIVIPSGVGSETVAAILEREGIVDSASSFDKYLCDRRVDRNLRSGSKTIPEDATWDEIASILTR